MSFSRILIYLLIAVVLLGTVSVVGKKAGWWGQSSTVEVSTKTVARRNIVETVSASGKIYPALEVKVSPDVSGEIIEIYAEEGDSVKEGDLLVKIRPDVYISLQNRADASVNQSKANLASSEARLLQVQAQFDNAKATYERNQKLWQQKVLSEADYLNALSAFKTSEGELSAAKQTVEASKFSVKVAEAALKEANDNLRQTNIYAPTTGTISMLNVEKGERVVGTTQMAGTEMLRVADLSVMEVQVDVTENDILRVSLGDTAEIEVDAYIGRKFKGIVTYIANSSTAEAAMASESVTNFVVKIQLLRSSYEDLIRPGALFPFKPGMSASVDIYTNQANDALSVPIQAITLSEDEPGAEPEEVLFVFDNGIAKKIKVVTGLQDNFYIEIKNGLTGDEEIITGPYRIISRVLKDGDPVGRIKEDEKPSKQQ
jgi:HlyD family secretion protein